MKKEGCERMRVTRRRKSHATRLTGMENRVSCSDVSRVTWMSQSTLIIVAVAKTFRLSKANQKKNQPWPHNSHCRPKGANSWITESELPQSYSRVSSGNCLQSGRHCKCTTLSFWARTTLTTQVSLPICSCFHHPSTKFVLLRGLPFSLVDCVRVLSLLL